MGLKRRLLSRWIKLTSVLLIAFMSQSAVAKVQDIHWLVSMSKHHTNNHDYEPLSINKMTASLVLDDLTGFRIQEQVINSNRMLEILETDPKACAEKTVKTETRQEFLTYSALPQVIFPSLRVYFRNDNDTVKTLLQSLAQNQLSLAQVLAQSPKLRIGIMDGRSYGDDMDATLSQPDLQAQIWRHAGVEGGFSIIEMVVAGRIDLFISSPTMLSHYLHQKQQAFVFESFLPVESPQYLLGYFACAKSPEGERVIKAVNQRHQQVVKDPAYLHAHLQHLEKGIHAEFLRVYNRIYGTELSLD